MGERIGGSLFAGIGGFDLACERVGIRVAYQVENDKFCNQVLERHFPNAERIGDINEFQPDSTHAVDILTGGFPCQDISVAGKGAGLAGSRSSLWFQFARIIKAVRPGWVLIENVPRLRSVPSSAKGRDFHTIITALDEFGYGVAWRSLDSQYFGVPQRRERVFIVGRFGKPCPPEILFEPESGARNPQKGRGKRADIARTVATGTNGSRYDGETETFITINDGGRKGYWSNGNPLSSSVVPTLDGLSQHAVAFQGDSKVTHGDKAFIGATRGAGTPMIAAPLKAESPTRRNGGSSFISDEFVIAKPIQEWSQNGGAMSALVAFNGGQSADAYGLAIGEQSPPIKATPSGSNQIPNLSDGMIVRRLTPLECERLQGFPDGWTKLSEDTPDSPRYKAFGNAVTVPVVEWILKRIYEAM